MKIIHVICIDNHVISGIKSVLSGLSHAQTSLGHKVLILNFKKTNPLLFENEEYVNGFVYFRKRLLENRPDIVVFHGGYVISYCLYAYYLRLIHIPYVFVPHGGTSKYNLKKKRLLKCIFNTLFTRGFILNSSGVIFLNEKERDNSIFRNMIECYGYVPNGVPLPSSRRINKQLSPTIRFVFLSRIDIKYKGLDILLKSIENFNHSEMTPNFEFLFYGGNSNEKIVKTFVSMVKETQAPVVYKGEVYGNDKKAAYEKANIYVLTSLSEGMPVSVLEALSFGCPCILTPQTNLGELILDHQAGWVAEPNIESITATIQQAYSDYKRCGEQYVNNAVNAVKAYSWDNIAKKSIQEYARLIKRY